MMPLDVPILETPRLRLRGWCESDLDGFAAMMADVDVARFTTPDGQPQCRMTAWRTMASMIGHHVLRGYGMWAVEERVSGSFVGRVGPLRPEGWPALEVGWGLARPHWGKGYAQEAARAAMAWCFDTMPDLDRIVHHIVADNPRSIATAEGVGSRWDGHSTVTLFDHTARIYAQSRVEFKGQL